MWLSKLKKKKTQYILLGIIFTIAVTLISASLVVTVASMSYSAKYYEGDSTPDIQLITTNERVKEKSKNWYELKRKEFRNYKNTEMLTVSTNLSLNGKVNNTMMSYIVPMNNKEELSNKLDIVDGNKDGKVPKQGKIWISSTTANLNNIKLGDKAKIIDSKGKTLEYNISAIVNDSNQSSTAMGVLYVYINKEDESLLKGFPKATMITMNTDEDSTKVSKELVKYIDEPLGGVAIDKNLYIAAASMNATMIGGFGLLASIVLTVVLILILRSNIKNNILKEYKSIGIYKAMGYSFKKIRNIYLYGYGAVSLIASAIGIGLSIPIIISICNIAFKNLGTYSIDMETTLILLAVFIIFNLLVYINIFMVLKSIRKIKPVEAITIGVTSSKKKMKKSLIKNNSSSLVMAINDMFKYKKNNFITLVMFVGVFYISTLFLNIAYTMLNLDSELYKIFGTANSQVVISAQGDRKDSIKEIREYLDEDIRVHNYYLWDVLGQNQVAIDDFKYKVNGGLMMATLYNEFNNKDFSISKGRNPKNNKEVAVSTELMKANNFKVGDYMTLKVDNKNREFLIVGSFGSMFSNGQSVRLKNDILKDNENKGNIAFVNLKDINNYEAIKKDIENKFNSITVDKVYSSLKDTASQVVETSVPVSLILLIGVLIFGIFNIVNILVIENLDKRKNYGIMKSLGFTTGYIKRRNDFRMMILAVLGAIVGVGLNLVTSRNLIDMTVGFDVFKFNGSMTGVLVIGIFILIALTNYICNMSINKISPVELINE